MEGRVVSMSSQGEERDQKVENPGHRLPTEKSREFICDDCGSRCTRSAVHDVEYGHKIGCGRRPDDWPSKSGGSAYIAGGDQ